jgi:hypothetical protein
VARWRRFIPAPLIGGGTLESMRMLANNHRTSIAAPSKKGAAENSEILKKWGLSFLLVRSRDLEPRSCINTLSLSVGRLGPIVPK